MKRPSIKILIVGDHSITRAGMKAMLTASDIRVVGEATTPHQLLRLVGALRPNMVLLDDQIRGVDGLDLLRRLKKKWPRMSVIMLTAKESPFYLSRAVALGCSGYILKTVEQQELVKAVRAVGRGECVVEPPVLQKLLQDMTHQHVESEANAEAELTVSEREVLRLITEGQTNRQIAHHLGYSIGTVKDYVQRIIQKLEVSDRTRAAVKAIRLELFG